METPPKVLVVDDDSTMRLLVVDLLKQAGYKSSEIAEAENGQIAWGFLQSHPQVELVVTDGQMPKMSGDKLTDNIKTNGHRALVLLMTGKPGAMNKSYASPDCLLVKPFTFEDFLTAVKELTVGSPV